MKSQYQLYGVPLSLFVGKVRGYLNYKGLDYQETAPTVYDLLIRFPKKVGAAVMPVIKNRDGECLADTTDIIETLESSHPQPTTRPSSPRQTIAAMLFEAWCDDVWHQWLCIPAGHFQRTTPYFVLYSAKVCFLTRPSFYKAGW